jgi:3-hydroxybutyryl-CoA dehydrogenase
LSKVEEVVGVIGAGAMGRGIAQIALAAGYAVILWDANAAAATEAAAFVTNMLSRAVEKGRMTADAFEQAKTKLSVAAGLGDFASATIVIEAIIENLDIKRKLFADLEAVVADDCILASNTSSLSVTAIAAKCRLPGRVAGYHFFNPVPLMKVVEVVDAVMTEPWVSERLITLSKAVGHKAVRTKDTPGFLVNHAGRAFGTEGLRIVSEGIASVVGTDEIMREAANFRMGPFELFDLTGLDVSLPVMESIYNQYYQEPRYRPGQLAAQHMAAGILGRKTGRGFYTYLNGEKQVPPAKAAPDQSPKKIWFSRDHAEVATLLEKLAAARGVTVETAAKPSKDAICFVTPVGLDATSTALELGLDPRQTVAIDPLFGLASRRTLMTTPLTLASVRAAAHGLLASDGVAVTVIHDSPGFVAQRTVATIVNIGCDIAQQRIATPEDINDAVRLGLGYPKGPLEFGDAVGAPVILAILEGLFSFYGDPRYRPSPWLKRRAMLGVSLMTAEG